MRLHSSWILGPPLMRIAPATPPPNIRSLFAALTIASPRASVRSPCRSVTFERHSAAISLPPFGLCPMAGNHRKSAHPSSMLLLDAIIRHVADEPKQVDGYGGTRRARCGLRTRGGLGRRDCLRNRLRRMREARAANRP